MKKYLYNSSTKKEPDISPDVYKLLGTHNLISRLGAENRARMAELEQNLEEENRARTDRSAQLTRFQSSAEEVKISPPINQAKIQAKYQYGRTDYFLSLLRRFRNAENGEVYHARKIVNQELDRRQIDQKNVTIRMVRDILREHEQNDEPRPKRFQVGPNPKPEQTDIFDSSGGQIFEVHSTENQCPSCRKTTLNKICHHCGHNTILDSDHPFDEDYSKSQQPPPLPPLSARVDDDKNNKDEQANQNIETCECPVCFEDVEQMRTMKCNHEFCVDCVEQITDPYNKFICPLCRHEETVLSKEQEERKINNILNNYYGIPGNKITNNYSRITNNYTGISNDYTGFTTDRETGVTMYSFSLNPEDYQPSGRINASFIPYL